MFVCQKFGKSFLIVSVGGGGEEEIWVGCGGLVRRESCYGGI